MLTEIQISNNMYHLKKQIEQIESELHEFTDLPNQIPELITSANLLRLNNFLMKSDDKKTVWEYDQTKLIENLKVHTSYIGALQRVTSKFILRSSEEDQLRLPETINQFNKLVVHNIERDGDPGIRFDEWQSDLYVLFSLTQLMKYEAQQQGLAKEVEVEYDDAAIQELAKQVASGKVDPDLQKKVEDIADKLKIVR